VVSFLLDRQPWPLEDESAAALVLALSAEQADDDGPSTPERRAAGKIEQALQQSERRPIQPTVSEARAILGAPVCLLRVKGPSRPSYPQWAGPDRLT